MYIFTWFLELVSYPEVLFKAVTLLVDLLICACIGQVPDVADHHHLKETSGLHSG